MFAPQLLMLMWAGQLDTTESAACALILHLARIELATFSVLG